MVVPLPAYLNCAYGSDIIFKEESHGEGHVDHAVRTTERKWIVLIEFHRFLDRLKGLSHEIEMNYNWFKATEPY